MFWTLPWCCSFPKDIEYKSSLTLCHWKNPPGSWRSLSEPHRTSFHGDIWLKDQYMYLNEIFTTQSVSQRLSVCLYFSPPVCLSVCLPVCLSVCLSICLPVCLSVCLSACLSVCLSACLSVCLSVCLPVCLSVCLSICLFDCLLIWLSLCLFIIKKHNSLFHIQSLECQNIAI